MRSRPPLLLPCLLAALLALAACGDDPVAPPVAQPAGGDAPGGMTPVVVDEGERSDAETAPPAPPPEKVSVEEGRRKVAELRAEMDRLGRELLASFERRTYSPVRNVGVTYAEGTVRLKTAGVTATYSFTFDASKHLDHRTIVARTDRGEDAKRPSVPTGTAKQIFDFTQLSLNGPYRFVVNYLPPTQVLLTPSKKGDNRIVTAQPHKHEVQTSYSVDSRDLVVIRGTSVHPQSEIVYLKWDAWRGRYLLQEITFHGTDAVTELEYEETDGAVVLSRAAIRKDGASWEAAFAYERIDKGDIEDPLAPVVEPVSPRDGDGDDDSGK